MTIGPNFLAVSMSTPSSVNEPRVRPNGRRCCGRRTANRARPRASESVLGGGAALRISSRRRERRPRTARSRGAPCSARRRAAAATRPPCACFFVTPSLLGEALDQVVHRGGPPPRRRFYVTATPDQRDVLDREVGLARLHGTSRAGSPPGRTRIRAARPRPPARRSGPRPARAAPAHRLSAGATSPRSLPTRPDAAGRRGGLAGRAPRAPAAEQRAEEAAADRQRRLERLVAGLVPSRATFCSARRSRSSRVGELRCVFLAAAPRARRRASRAGPARSGRGTRPRSCPVRRSA